ncbi:MAG: peptidylprolyl isomerase [Schleiferiaceae bacterium]|jgi:peptidyl-prolyl cis-trans isomerase B (cyclophilin B)|nr:peptidylprolyl isomerase [Schleiferiaceae bacterium]
MRLRNLGLIGVIALLLSACDSDVRTAKQPSKKTPKKKEKNIVVEPIKDTLIRNNNVVERLTTYGEKNPETIADVYTRFGKIRIQLFKDTPLHRANFIMLAKSGYFNGTVFTRAVKNFIAQGGSAHSYQQVDIQRSIGLYTIPPEMDAGHFHYKGMIGAARDYEDNPQKRSDPFVFYFVEGTTYNDEVLDHYEKENGYKYNSAQRKYYTNNPGAAHIDGEHTVFGKIISGYPVVSKITSVETDRQDWPIEDLFIDSVIVVR